MGPDLPSDQSVDPDLDPAGSALRASGSQPFARNRRARWPRLSPSGVGAVFAGGVAGGLSRYGITELWPTPAARFPWATFTVNTAGALVLALLVLLLVDLGSPHRLVRPLVGTGFLGGFTTFSSVMTATYELADAGRGELAALYLGGSLLAALGAASFGLVLARAIVAGRHGGSGPRMRRAR